MADEFDRASDLEALNLQSALNLQAKAAAKQPKVEATGFCLHCGAELNDGRRWCDAECRDEWQLENPGA